MRDIYVLCYIYISCYICTLLHITKHINVMNTIINFEISKLVDLQENFFNTFLILLNLPCSLATIPMVRWYF